MNQKMVKHYREQLDNAALWREAFRPREKASFPCGCYVLYSPCGYSPNHFDCKEHRLHMHFPHRLPKFEFREEFAAAGGFKMEPIPA